MHGGRLKFVIK